MTAGGAWANGRHPARLRLKTDKACSAPLPGKNLPGASCLSQPRTSTRETTFGNLAQQAVRCARRRL